MKKLFSLIICISVLVMSISGLNLTVFAALEGDGTEENPYIITTADEFESVNWKNGSDLYYLIKDDIVLSKDYSSVYFNTNLKGDVKADGSKYTITVDITSQNQNVGLFNSFDGGTIENLEFTGTISFSGATAMRIGGIASKSTTTVTIKNCISSINISGESTNAYAAVGGFVGYPAATTIEECEYKGNINVTVLCGVGGIAGHSNGSTNKIINCINSGDIVNGNTSGKTGGIMGRTYTNDSIENCINKGKVTSKGIHTGGVLGYMEKTGTVTNCINKGEVIYDNLQATELTWLGGVVGKQEAGTVSGCSNEGTVYDNSTTAISNGSTHFLYIAGIIGSTNQASASATSNINKGTIKSNHTNNTYIYAGGISGYNAGTISKCANLSGEIAVRQFGGIAGRNGGSIMLSYNTVDLPNTIGFKGGIAARNDKTISNCFNIGDAQGQHSGGIVGAFNSGGTISNVYTVVSKQSCNTITNTNNGTLTNAYYVIKDGGSVTGTLTGTEATFDELIKNTTDFSDANGWQVLAISDTNKYPLPQLKDNPYYLAFSICRAKDNVVITTAPVTQIPDMVEEGEEYIIKGHDGNYTVKANTRYAAIFSKVNEYYGWGIKEYGVEVDGVQYPSKLSLTSDLSYGIVLENTPEEITVKSYAVYYEINNPDNKITVYSNVE